METSKEINVLQSCAMIEIKQENEHSELDKKICCECSECGTRITADAEFDSNGKLRKVAFPLNYCPNCRADIEKFIQYKFK